ncbi:MAG: porin family protein [Chitinophagales bacterium]|nr:porin family protein [Chitinophagales bacterium]
MNIENNNRREKLNELKNYSSPIDLSKEWAALEQRLNKRKKRRGFFWIFPTIPVSTGLVSWMAYSLMEPKATPMDVLAQTVVNLTTTNNPLTHEASAEITSDLDLYQNLAVHLTETTSDLQHGVTDTKRIDEVSNIKPDAENNSKIYAQNTFKNASKDNVDIIELTDNQRIQQVANESKNMAKVAVNITQQVDLNDQETIAQIHDKTEPKAVETHAFDQSAINYVMVAPITALQFEALSSMLAIEPLSMSSIGISPLKKRNAWFADVRMLGGQQVYRYKQTTIEPNEMLDQRKISEKPLESYGASFIVGKEMGYGWYIAAGINWMRHQERWMTSGKDYDIITLPDFLIETYTNFEGKVVETVGEKQVLTTTDWTKIRFTQHHVVSPMVAVGKQFYINTMRLSIEGSLAMPIYSANTGDVWQQPETMIDLKKLYDSKAYPHIGCNISYIYPLSEKLSIYGGYQYQYTKLKSDAGFFRHQHFHGLGIGIKYFIHH